MISQLLELEQRYQNGPTLVAIRGAAVTDSSGDAIAIDCGGPALQRRWEVRRLIIGGDTWSSAVAGDVQVYVDPGSPLGRPGLSSVISDISPPKVSFFSPAQLVLRHPQRLWVMVSDPSVSTQYVVSGGGFDFADIPQERIVSR